MDFEIYYQLFYVCDLLSWKLKIGSKETKRALNGNNNHLTLYIYLCFAIWKHGNHGKLLFLYSYECQKNQIQNPFNPILGFS
jgi:hypothetical protein